MASIAEKLGLGPTEFAFYFETGQGVEADHLGSFLQRAATVARQNGAEIRVTGIQPGSLAVILKAVKKSKIVQAAKDEYLKAPIDATVKVTALVGSVVAGITWAMSPSGAGVTPLAKAGAEIVEQHQVNQIQIVTIDNTIVVMDEERAREIRQIEREKRRPSRPRLPYEVQSMVEDARFGTLAGSILAVDGDLHFRPDGYRYLVPVDMANSWNADKIFPGDHIKVAGEIVTIDGQPDSLVIHSIRR